MTTTTTAAPSTTTIPSLASDNVVTATVQELIARAEVVAGFEGASYALAPLLALDLAPVDVAALRSACLVLVARKVGTRDRRSALREVAIVCDSFDPDPARHGTAGDFSAAMPVWEAAARAWPRSGWAAGLAALQADEAERSASLARARAELL